MSGASISGARSIACQTARQPDDLAAVRTDVVVDENRVRESGPIEIAVDFGRDDNLAVAIRNFKNFQGDLCLEDLTVAPALDRSTATKLAPGVVDEGVVGEEFSSRVAQRNCSDSLFRS
jgi:hypothetical protein